MASPSSQDWLELGLGFRTTKKQQKQQQEDEINLASATPHHHLEGYDDEEEEEEEEEEGLDLRLQIGPKNDNNINMGVDLVHQKKQKWPLFHMDSITNFDHSSHGLSSPPNSGLWFSLRSSANRKGGAALPQIPKAYIRVKDENMTVFMVKKYLVTKLGLSNEAEVEIWCMGERLVQSQTLKQVRDGVWLPKLVQFVNSNTSLLSPSIFHHSSHYHHHHHYQTPSSSTTTTTYLMSLHYGRTCLF